MGIYKICILQVLGRDILKSSLLDDIDLYLECDDDSLYVMPTVMSPTHSSGMAFYGLSFERPYLMTDLNLMSPTFMKSTVNLQISLKSAVSNEIHKFQLGNPWIRNP